MSYLKSKTTMGTEKEMKAERKAERTTDRKERGQPDKQTGRMIKKTK
jgi:hypothetical protein